MKIFFRTIKTLFKLTRYHTIVIICVLILSALMAPISLYSIEKLIDSIVNYNQHKMSYSLIILWGTVTVTAFLLVAITAYAQRIQILSIKKILYDEYSENILKKFTHLEYSCFEETNDHDIVKNMGDSPQEKVLELFLSTTNVIRDFITVVGFAVLFIRISLWFSFFAVLVLTFMIFFHTRAMTMMEKLYVDQTKDERLLAYFDEILSNKKTLSELRLNNAINRILIKQKNKAKEILDIRLKSTIKSQLMISNSTLMFVFWLALIVFGLSSSLINQSISIGMFVSLIASTNSIMISCFSISENLSKFLRTNLRLIHYEYFMTLPSLSEVKSDYVPHQIKEIIFQNVTFIYPGSDHKALDNVSFVLYGDKCSAIVGYNGAGKSTIIKLLCRLYEPTNGKIYINGVDIKTYSYKKYYSLFGFMFQDFGKYYFTLRENVAFGDIKSINNNKKLIHQLDLVNLNNLNNELNKTMGNFFKGGIDLSGGQWQRVAIARCTIASSKMFILDEPTASLDPKSENNFYALISDLMCKKGCILISHRLAAAKLSNTIIVLDHGRVVEQGNHKELLQYNGTYAHMFYEQSKWYRDEVQ